MNASTHCFIALALILVALQRSAAENPDTSMSRDIPLLPYGIHLGISEEDFVQQRPFAIMLDGLLPKQKPDEVKERAETIYIESEIGGLHRSAITYQFNDGVCSMISFEAYLPSNDYSVMRGDILDAFLRRFGAAPQRRILHTEEPAEGRKGRSAHPNIEDDHRRIEVIKGQPGS